jgi:hypothetical protein
MKHRSFHCSEFWIRLVPMKKQFFQSAQAENDSTDENFYSLNPLERIILER